MTKDEYIEKVNDIRLRMCKEVAFVTAEYLKRNQDSDFDVESEGLCVKCLPNKEIARLSFHGMVQRDFSLLEVSLWRDDVFLQTENNRNAICYNNNVFTLQIKRYEKS